MPKGKKFGGRDWKPGQSGNPKGPTPTPPEIKELRRMNRIEVEQLVNDYWMLPKKRLKEIFDDPETPSRDAFICQMIMRGRAEGNPGTFNIISDYLFGEKPKQINVKNSGTSQAPPVIVNLIHNGSEKSED